LESIYQTTYKSLNTKLIWLIAAILYGFSWPIFTNLNLSFLAWFSFTILFHQLKRINDFRKYFAIVFLFLYIAHFIPFWWVFNIPINKALVLLATIQDTFIVSIPYILLFFLKKKTSFKNALILVGVFLPAWEWIYTELENTIGFMNIGYSQANNQLFIQSADIIGVYGITMMVWFLNVLVFAVSENYKNRITTVKYLAFFLVILFLNFTYGFFRIKDYSTKNELKVLLLKTDYEPIKKSEFYWEEIYSDILQKTDSSIARLNDKPDLIVWPESIINENWGAKKDLIESKISKWQTPILLGLKAQGNNSEYNQIKLMNTDTTEQYYNKIKLTPFWEGVPFLSHYFNFENFMKPGNELEIFELNNQSFGTPICFELLYPSIWIKMRNKGADFFIQSNYESWFGKNWYQNVFVGITKIRAIENGTTVIRCSNGGTSGVIYPNKKCDLLQSDHKIFKAELLDYQTIIQKIYFYIPFVFISLFILLYILIMKKNKS
jgi:apolipoprotein N-acyltransferase